MSLTDRFADIITAKPKAIITAVILLTLLACLGVIRLNIVTDYRYFFDESHPDMQAFASMENEFGGTDDVLLAYAPASGDVFTPANMLLVGELPDALQDTPHADGVTSVADVTVAVPGPSGPIMTSLRSQALATPFDPALWKITLAEVARFTEGTLLARDGSMAAAYVKLALPQGNGFWDTRAVQVHAKKVRADFEARYPGERVLLAGMLPYYHDITELAMRDVYTLFPVCIFIAALLLYALLGSWAAAGACGLPVLCAVVTTIGLNCWLGLPIGLPSMIVPIIVLVIALAYSIHYADTYLQLRDESGSSRAAAVQSFKENLKPALLTSITTGVGFLMMNASVSPPYRHMGNVAAIGVTVSVLYTVLLMPAMLTLLDPGYGQRKGRLRSALESLGERFSSPVRSPWMLGLGFVVVLMLLAGVRQNIVDDNISSWFDEDTRMRQDNAEVDARLSGLQHIFFRLPASSEIGVHDPVYLKTVAAFGDWLQQQPHVDTARTLATLVSSLNMTFGEGSRSIPQDPAQTEQLLWVYEFTAPAGDRAGGLMNAERSASIVHVARHNRPGQDFRNFAADAHAWLQENASDIDAPPGRSGAILFTNLALESIPQLIIGTLAVLLFSTVVIAIALQSVRLGLISIVPNLLPVGLAFGSWGFLSGHVGIALSVIATAAVGIIVDDTIHLLQRYKDARKAASASEACRHAIRRVGGAITITTMVLVVGIGLIGFSEVQPSHELGIWLSMTIAYAWFCDLILLPQLLTRFDAK